MRDLTWSETLSVAVEEIDEDHRRMVELFNFFAHAVAEKEATDYLKALLEELVAYTAWHFKHEERLMLRYGYHGFVEHKQEHQELINEVAEIRQELLRAEMQATDEQIEVLERWLVEHILVTDMKLGNFLTAAM